MAEAPMDAVVPREQASRPTRITPALVGMIERASQLYAQYVRSEDPRDLSDAINLGRLALRSPDLPSNVKSYLLADAADLHWVRFHLMGSMLDLDESVDCSRDSILLCSQDDVSRLTKLLNTFETRLSRRYALSKQGSDLNESIGAARLLLSLSQAQHPEVRAMRCDGLADKLAKQFEQTGDLTSLSEAIEASRAAVELVDESSPNKAAWLNNLSVKIVSRFRSIGELDDLEEALVISQQAVDVMLDDAPAKGTLVSNLSQRFAMRFELLGSRDDLDLSVKFARQALDVTPKDSPGWIGRLDSLGDILAKRFDHYGRLADLDEAISLARQALDEPNGSSKKPALLHNLGNKLQDKFQHRGEISDLNEAISLAREALSLSHDAEKQLAFLFSGSLASKLELRSKRLGNFDDLEESINMSRKALELIPPGNPYVTNLLTNLSIALGQRFAESGRAEDLDEAVSLSRRAAASCPDTSSWLATAVMINLVTSLELRFSHSGSLRDLEESITVARKAVFITPEQRHERLAQALDKLANVLQAKSVRLGTLGDLNEAVILSQRANELTPVESPDKHLRLRSMAGKLDLRYKRLSQLDDLEQAVSLSRESLEFTPDDSPLRPTSLSGLANKLELRFQRLGQLQDLEEGLGLVRQAIALVPTGDSTRADLFDNLGNKFELRFERTGQISDLEDAIAAARRAVSLVSDGTPCKNGFLSNLGNKLELKYEQLNRLADLEEAIEVTQKAADLTAQNNVGLLPTILSNLGNKLQFRFRRLGKFADLERAIELSRRAVDLTPEASLARASFLSNWASRLDIRYDWAGQLPDLEEAVTITRLAVQITPGNSPDKAAYLHGLGKSLGLRFERLGYLQDLEDAIEMVRQAVSCTPVEQINMVYRRDTLGNLLHERYNRLGRLPDIDEAIEISREAIRLTPSSSYHAAAYLHNLSIHLQSRYKAEHDTRDLDDAIDASRKAVELTREEGPAKAKRLNSFGNALGDRFNILGAPEDLEAAIAAARQAVDLVPDDHCDKAPWMGNLARWLMSRYKLHAKQEDLEEAVKTFKSGSSSEIANVFHRIGLGTVLTDVLKSELRFAETLDAAKALLELIPRVNTRALAHADQLHAISYFAGLGSDVCALELECGNCSEAAKMNALIALEAGRGAVIALAMEDRADVTNLHEGHPELAERFVNSRMALSKPDPPTTDAEEEGSEQPRKSPFQMLQDFNECLEAIRALPNHADYLRPPSIPKMMAAAAGTTIVYVNVNTIRSDAILVTETKVTTLNLPKLAYQRVNNFALQRAKAFYYSNDAERRTKNKNLSRFLHWLWTACVQPIFETLGFIQDLDEEKPLPRVHWIGAGPASTLPFHAAGDHSISRSGAERSTTMDHVVSTCIPSIQTLLHTKSRQRTTTPGDQRIMLATMTTTPNESELAGVLTETAAITTQLLDTKVKTTMYPQASSTTILEALQSHSIFHFAGHGTANAADPSQSSLIFERFDEAQKKTVQDPLRVQQLFDLDIANAELAFLSACSTADNPVHVLADEGLHLAAGFLVGGFRNVVASQWPADDAVCVEIASEFYRHLDLKPSKAIHRDDAARALHLAVEAVRASRRDMPILWAPYVHLGV